MSQKYTIARLTVEKDKFEILVKPDPALKYKQGEQIGISKILVIDEIYSDANKGSRVSTDTIHKIFKTQNIQEAAETILREGEFLITAEQRRNLIKDKKKQIINFISRNCLDPRSNTPHPPLRIEQAMEKIRISIDPFKPMEEQAKSILDMLKRELPIKMENLRLSVLVSSFYSHKAYGVVKTIGSITKDEWLQDGSWSGIIEIPAGMYGSFIDKLGKITQGTVQIKKM